MKRFVSWKEVILLSLLVLTTITLFSSQVTATSNNIRENSNFIGSIDIVNNINNINSYDDNNINTLKTLTFPKFLKDITDTLVKSSETYNNTNILIINNNPIYIFSLKEKNITKMNDLIGKKVAVYNYFEDIIELKFQYENISGIESENIDYIDCECINQSFQEFDAFIYDLNQYYLLTLTCFKNSKRDFYNWNDFNIIDLNIPYELKYSFTTENVNNISNDFFNLQLIQVDNMTNIQHSITANNNNSVIPDPYNAETYNFMLVYSKSNFGIITQEQLNFLNYLLIKFNNLNSTQIHNLNNTIPLQILYNKLLPTQQHLQWKSQQEFINWINNNFTISFDFIDTKYYQCYSTYTNRHYFCNNHALITNQILYNDIATFITILCVIIYYLALIPMVNKPSIKIRLALPYLAPLFVLIGNIILIVPIMNRCFKISMVFQVTMVALIVGVYGLTLFRVVYLRNIYKIIESFSGNQIKFIKVLTSKGSGIVITIIFTLVYALFWFAVAMIITFTLKYKNSSNLGVTSLFALCVLVNVVLGTICMIIEIILNVKTIRKEGLRNFLFFDDPFYQRFDLIALVVIFCVVIPIPPFAGGDKQYIVAILRTIAYITVLFLSGGTTLIFEYFNSIVNYYHDLFKKSDKKENDKESQLSELEQNLENSSFYKLLKKYAEKEFSLENILLYDQLMILKTKHKDNSLILKEELNNLSKDYIQSYSKYEVNFPSKVKIEFLNVISENRNVTFNQLYDILKTDLMLNIGDTCKRLEKTSEYRQLMDFLTLQKEHHIV
ncbi:hypothetical protein ABK040_014816 [Willaertia magna]